MDDLRLLSSLLSEPPPTREVTLRGRTRLLALTARHRRSGWRMGVRLGLGTAAMVTAVAVTVSLTGPRAPNEGDGAVAKGGGVTSSAAPSARAVLLAAAEEQLDAPATAGRYWYTRSRFLMASQAGPAGDRYVIEGGTEDRLWVPAKGSRGWASSRGLGWRPQGTADAEAWRRAGSPARFESGGVAGPLTTVPGTPGPPSTMPPASTRPGLPPATTVPGMPAAPSTQIPPASTRPGTPAAPSTRIPPASTRPGAPAASNTPAGSVRSAEAGAWGAPERVSTRLYILDERHQMTVAELRALPTDPARLRAWLLERLRVRAPEPAAEAEILFGAAETLLGMPVTPEVRAAAYRMLAELPGLRVADGVTDPLGRAGDAVALRRPDTAVERQLVIDPGNGALLSAQDVLVAEDSTAWPGVPVGTRLNAIAMVEARWTDRGPKG